MVAENPAEMHSEAARFDRYVRRIFLGTLALTLVPAVIFLVAGSGEWSRGVILGGAASMAGLVLMARDVRRQGAASAGQAVGPGYGNYALRMFIIAAALVYAAINTRIALWAAIPAVFLSQLVMTLGEVLDRGEQEPS